MKKVLGLDLGTSSIGWAVVNQAENTDEKSSIVKLGVRISQLEADEKTTFETGKGETESAIRSLKRGMRRNLQRYKQRRDKLKDLLINNNIISKTTKLSEDGMCSTYQTLELRAKAAKEEISLEELGRVLLIINKKRGYKSNRKASNEEEGELIDGMAVARELYRKGITPGEYVYELLKSQKRYKPSFYRSDLQAELETVWNKQAEYYPTLLDSETRRKIEGKGKTDTRKLFYAAHNISAAEEKDRKLRQITYYQWRAWAVRSRIEPEQLVTVLSEINGDIAASSGYLGAIGDHSKELEINHLTVGEYLFNIIKENPHNSLKNIVFYRNDYIHEFNTIWETQSRFHKELTPELKEKIANETIFFQRRLKSQKGLISFCELEGKQITIGGKKVMTGPRVCPKSSPLFQEFKIWQDLNNLLLEDKTSRNGDKIPLTIEQKQRLYKELYCTKELSAKDAIKVLGLKDKEYGLNFKKLQGNITQVTLLNAYKSIVEMTGHDVEKFDKMDAENKLHLVGAVLEMLGAKTDFLTFDPGNNADEMQQNAMFKLWHLLYSYEDDNTPTGNGKLVDHIAELTGLSHEYASLLARVTFVQDFGSLSTKAMMKILPYMKNEGMIYPDACQAVGYNHSKLSLTKEENERRVLADHLDLLPKNTLRNPVVEKIVNQMIHVVNGCIVEFGAVDNNGKKFFDEIHIEMARCLKQTKKQRADTTEYLNKKTKKINEIKDLLLKKGVFPSKTNILKYQLYEELAPNGFKTLYSDTDISFEDLFFSNKFEIEHIIPKALKFDDSFSNKTLETHQVNNKKEKMTAIDYIANEYGEDGVSEYIKRISFLNNKNSRKKYNNLKTRENEIKNDFINRELSDTQYIAKKAKELLMQVTRKVVPTTGSITARLRSDWQLVDVMKELNWDKYNKLGLTTIEKDQNGHRIQRIKDWSKRNDHRHHAMDALTVAFTRDSHIQYLNNLNAKEDWDKKDYNIYGIEKKELVNGQRFMPPIPLDEFRVEALKHLSGILVSIKAKNKVTTKNVNRIKGGGTQITLTPRGQLHNEMIYGRRYSYVKRLKEVDKTFDINIINTVCRKDYRNALIKRLEENEHNPLKAFMGKNALKKNPLYVDEAHSMKVPEKVMTVVLSPFYTIRKPINGRLNVNQVVDNGIREILKQRLAQFNNNASKAFSNIDKNPIWLNKEKGIAIKTVTIKVDLKDVVPLHLKKDKYGNIMTNNLGENEPTDYVNQSNNHHVAIFKDEKGELHEHLVSFADAIKSKIANTFVVDTNYNVSKGWMFCFSIKKNELFVFPDLEKGFNPELIDLEDPSNYRTISSHLYRVRSISHNDYKFVLHLETTITENPKLKNTTWKRIRNPNGLKGIRKVRINHLGNIKLVYD